MAKTIGSTVYTQHHLELAGRGGDRQGALKTIRELASRGNVAAQQALQMCASGIITPGAVAGTTDPQAMFESWKLDYMNAYSGSQPVSLLSGLAKRYEGASKKSHLPIPPSGMGPLETMVDGEPQGGQKAQGYDVPFEHETKSPRGLIVNRSDMASDRVGMVAANVIAHGNDAAMIPDFRVADALALAETTQLSFDRVLAFSTQHIQNPANPAIGPKYSNKFNEKLDVPGLVKIVNGMAGYRNESGLTIMGRKRQYGIIVPADLEGDLSYLLDRDRDALGATNWAHIFDFVGIVLPTLTDPKKFYVCVLNGPVAPVYFSVHIPWMPIFKGPGSDYYDFRRQFFFGGTEDNIALVADWRMIAMSKIP